MAQIDYPAHLSAMWEKAKLSREVNAPKVISTFAGGGGSLTGYMMAGFDDVLAVEWDDNAVQTLRLNWPELDIYHGDIAKLSVNEVLKRTGLQPGELDVLDGSPPCQGFSTAGKRIMDDPRNQLFREYVRFLYGLRPKVFVMENVSGMVKGKMKLLFVEILKELKASGYQVSAKLLNAKYFHVPQSRERMIFIGVRNDLGVMPSHPAAENQPISFGNAVIKIEDAKENPACVSALKEKRWLETRPGKNHHKRFSLVRLSFDKPSPTLQKSSSGTAGHMHPSIPRHLNGAELRRIGSFPDEYKFFGNSDNVLNRIGNSVPPLFMEAIARHIRQEILDKVDA